MSRFSIRVARASLVAVACLSGACAVRPDASGTTSARADPGRSIFNGVDLSGWEGDPRRWRVEDGLLTGETTAAAPIPHNTFLIYRGAEVGDFELTLDYVIRSDWANSGVQYRSVELPTDAAGVAGHWIVGGAQADIDEPVTYTGILYGERDRGILALRGQQVEIGPGGAPKVVGSLGDAADLATRIGGKNTWNSYRIRVQGNRATHVINGVTMVDVVDRDAVAIEPGAKGARMRGIIALQLHAGQPMKIQFRNIRLRTLD